MTAFGVGDRFRFTKALAYRFNRANGLAYDVKKGSPFPLNFVQDFDYFAEALLPTASSGDYVTAGLDDLFAEDSLIRSSVDGTSRNEWFEAPLDNAYGMIDWDQPFDVVIDFSFVSDSGLMGSDTFSVDLARDQVNTTSLPFSNNGTAIDPIIRLSGSEFNPAHALTVPGNGTNIVGSGTGNMFNFGQVYRVLISTLGRGNNAQIFLDNVLMESDGVLKSDVSLWKLGYTITALTDVGPPLNGPRIHRFSIHGFAF